MEQPESIVLLGMKSLCLRALMVPTFLLGVSACHIFIPKVTLAPDFRPGLETHTHRISIDFCESTRSRHVLMERLVRKGLIDGFAVVKVKVPRTGEAEQPPQQDASMNEAASSSNNAGGSASSNPRNSSGDNWMEAGMFSGWEES